MNFADAYDPETFRAAGHRLVDELASYLARARKGELPVLASIAPEDLIDAVSGEFPAAPVDDIVATLMNVVRHSNHLHHPRFIGHQVASVLPAAILAEATVALLNNGMAIYEMGQLHTVMEHHVVAFLASKLGFPTSAGGVLTNGGSLGNLTALLAMRQARAGYDIWTEGQSAPLAVMVSDQAHYCLSRAVQSMGWGAAGAIAVPSDERYRMRVDELDRCLARAREQDRQVLGVVASCCSTATGSFDPLPDLADFCEANDLWLHIDGAHGASLVLSEKHRGVLTGIERADSVVWDLHKMMALPALNTAVLFRDGRRSYESFAQEAGYLFDGDEPEWFTLGKRTLECTKRGMSVTAYTMLRGLGTDFFAENVDRLVDRTVEFSRMLEAESDFEVAAPPAANILCFRHAPDRAETDQRQAEIRRRIVASGRFYITQARVRGRLWLRVTVMNPFTTRADLVELIAEIRRHSRAS